jgi:starvation-inducible DNA-binding protein
MAPDVAETTRIERPPRGREEVVPSSLSRLVDALGDDGTNDLIVRQVLRTNELQMWFLSEHLVTTPLTKAVE